MKNTKIIIILLLFSFGFVRCTKTGKNVTIKGSSSGLFSKDLIPHPDQAAVNYQNELKNNFQHAYTHSTDTRKTFPSFSRNIAVSMGSYKEDYNAKWGLHSGKKLFTQHAPSSFYVPVLGFQPGMVNRKLWASKYSSTSPQSSFVEMIFMFF